MAPIYVYCPRRDLTEQDFKMILTVKDLKHVRKILNRVRRKWYKIGIELEIDTDQLDTIKSVTDDPDDCLIEMLKVWLKSLDPVPTWVALSEALISEDEYELAREGTL